MVRTPEEAKATDKVVALQADNAKANFSGIPE
jgi:hypothetical protein